MKGSRLSAVLSRLNNGFWHLLFWGLGFANQDVLGICEPYKLYKSRF